MLATSIASDHLALTVCSCFCCWPVALMAIYNSRLVRFFYGRGQYLHVRIHAMGDYLHLGGWTGRVFGWMESPGRLTPERTLALHRSVLCT
jgi:hypothetical protein